MAIVNLNTIKNWFRTAKKPTQGQFWDTWDSFWHKLERISIEAIDGLQNILNNKVDTSQFDGHVNNKNNPHEVTIGQVGGVSVEQLNTETQSRVDGDNDLQQQIDDLQKITAIRGNVDTHADLLAIDTANMRDGDSYIVEVDETHDNKATIYAFDADFPQWIYTGEWSTAVDLSAYQKTDEKGTPNGYAPLDADNKVPATHLPESTPPDLSGYQNIHEKGNPYGYAPLGYDNKVPAEHLPTMGGGGDGVNIGNSNLELTDHHRALSLEGGIWDIYNKNIYGTNIVRFNGEIDNPSILVEFAGDAFEILGEGQPFIRASYNKGNIGSETELLIQVISTVLYSRLLDIRVNVSLITIENGMHLELQNPEYHGKFPYINDYGILEFLNADEFKAKLGL